MIKLNCYLNEALNTNANSNKDIDNWMRANLQGVKYTVDNDSRIICKGGKLVLYKDYDELPEYINFKDCSESTVVIDGSNISKIKSFNGFPETCLILDINGARLRQIPDLSVECTACYINTPNLRKIDNVELNFVSNLSAGTELNITAIGVDNLDDFEIYNLQRLFVVDTELSEKIQDIIGIDNSKDRKYEPSVPVGQDEIEDLKRFFGKLFSSKELTKIQYTKLNSLIKHNNKWYNHSSLE